MRSTLFDDEHFERHERAGFQLQNPWMLKVELDGRIHARRGTAIAYQGHLEFAYRGRTARQWLLGFVSSEGVPLMDVTGRGDVFFGAGDKFVHIVRLERERLHISGEYLLALSSGLAWDVRRVKGGASSWFGSGLYDIEVSGTGELALMTDSKPVVLDASERPTFVEYSSLVAWTPGISPEWTWKGNVGGSVIGRSTGEGSYARFSGKGVVIVENGGLVRTPRA